MIDQLTIDLLLIEDRLLRTLFLRFVLSVLDQSSGLESYSIDTNDNGEAKISMRVEGDDYATHIEIGEKVPTPEEAFHNALEKQREQDEWQLTHPEHI